MKNRCLFGKCNRIGSTVAVKSGQLGGHADTFMPIFSADTLDFLVRYIPGTDLAVNFDLVKCKTKNKYT